MGRVIIAILLIISCIIVLAGCQAAPPQPTPPPTSPTPAPEISPEPAATSTEEESSISVLAITSVSPDLGPLEGDTIIQISGENITSGAIVFFIQGDVAQEGVRTTVLSDTVIVTRTPSVSRAGFADIQVALPDGQTATLGDAFRYTTGFEAPPVTTPPPQVVPVSSEKLKVHFVDVGQGDAIFIDLEDIEILIDGGGKSPGVVSYISQYVDGTLEVVVATHPHADHIGGLIEVLDEFEVKQIWHSGDDSDSATYKNFMAAVQSENAEVHIAKLHDVINAEGLSFYVHNPSRTFNSTNNNSIVLHLAHGNIDFLFTGDAEKEAEGAMMALSSVSVPDVEILKVGHHGSKTASSKDFVAITSPEVAIYMAAEGNRYGHPHEESITVLNAVGAKIYGTDIHGDIVVTTDGETYTLQLEKQAEPLSVTAPTPPPAPTPTPTPTPQPTPPPAPSEARARRKHPRPPGWWPRSTPGSPLSPPGGPPPRAPCVWFVLYKNAKP